MKKDAVRITVRFTPKEEKLHKALVKSAEGNRRSLNAEMLAAFEYYLTREAERRENKEDK
jgi:hypothetical protein